VLQCVAVCCSVLQCVATHDETLTLEPLQCDTVRGSVLQCVAVYCSLFHIEYDDSDEEVYFW